MMKRGRGVWTTAVDVATAATAGDRDESRRCELVFRATTKPMPKGLPTVVATLCMRNESAPLLVVALALATNAANAADVVTALAVM